VTEAKDYTLVYDLDLTKNGGNIAYAADNHASITKPFDRIAYFLELQPSTGESQYLYVSMDAFTADLGKIGVPTVASKAFFQQDVKNMNVLSNVKGIVTGDALTGGNIEFWPNNYGRRIPRRCPMRPIKPSISAISPATPWPATAPCKSTTTPPSRRCLPSIIF